jgi:hypothetical protein
MRLNALIRAQRRGEHVWHLPTRLLRDSGERCFRWIASEYALTRGGGLVRNGATVGISASSLRRGYRLYRIEP